MEHLRLVAIDGGGTKTEFVLTGGDGHILRRVTGGSSNPIDLGADAACAVLREGLDALLDGDFTGTLDGLFAGISGGASSGAAPLTAYLRELLPHANARVDGDTVPAIASVSLSGDGCALIAGTGSSASARYRGRRYRSGGWGYLFDGAGGGYDLGQAVISHALAAGDLREERTVVCDLLEARLGETAAQHLRVFYEQGKRYIAGFAPLLLEAADLGDPFALGKLDRNAAHMARVLEALFAQVERDIPGSMACPAVAMVGGLFRRKDLWEPRLAEMLRRPCERIYDPAPAVFGAAAEASRMAGQPVTEAFRDAFLRDWDAMSRV